MEKLPLAKVDGFRYNPETDFFFEWPKKISQLEGDWGAVSISEIHYSSYVLPEDKTQVVHLGDIGITLNNG